MVRKIGRLFSNPIVGYSCTVLKLAVTFGDVAQQATHVKTAKGAMGNCMSFLCSVTL